MARDSERKKTYIAEYDYRISNSTGEIHAFQVQQKVNEIVASKWWGKRSAVRQIPVSEYRSSDWYGALRHSCRRAQVWMPAGRYRFPILDLMHEIAHIMRPGRYLHDKDFRADMLELIGEWVDTETAEKMGKVFKRYGLE